MRKQSVITSVCWIALGAAISLWASTFPFGTLEETGPAIFPLGCGLTLILLGIILFFQRSKNSEEKPSQNQNAAASRGTGRIRFVLSLGGMLLAALLFDRLGFVLTVFCLVLFLLRVSQPQKWRTDLFYSLSITLGSFLLFRVILKTTLPAGALGF